MFTIQLDNIKAPIDRMLVLYIKSYGREWESSRILLVVEGSKKNRSGGGGEGGGRNTNESETLGGRSDRAA
jgi:hypothetical protein